MRKFLFVFLFFISFNVYALERIALVIGNADYHGEFQLKKSINDAEDIEASLKELGFDKVMLITDADIAEMKNSLEKFSSWMKESNTSLFYFSGHAVQLGSKNYLLPIHSIIRLKNIIEITVATMGPKPLATG